MKKTIRLRGLKQRIAVFNFQSIEAAMDNEKVVRLLYAGDGAIAAVIAPGHKFISTAVVTKAYVTGRRGDQVMVEP